MQWNTRDSFVSVDVMCYFVTVDFNLPDCYCCAIDNNNYVDIISRRKTAIIKGTICWERRSIIDPIIGL